MRIGAWIAALGAGAVALAAGELWAQDAQKSVWDGVYTEPQAERGAAAYARNCANCHGPQLAGTGEAKPLTGPEFLANWSGLTMADLFDRTRTTMPLDKPATLSRETYADVLAYVLKFNGYPAGAAELDRRSEMLATIRIEAERPAASASGAGVLAAANEPVASAPNSQPNPYVADAGFFKMPPGRTMGSSSGVGVDSRGHIWIAERCGANNCAGSTLDPILEFDAKGAFIKAFGKGMLLFPHGLFIDAKDHVWVTDGHAEPGKGAQVFEFDNTGKLLRALGKAGVSAEGPDTFAEPNAVVVAPDGTIFVADGHTAGKGPARIVKLDAGGRFLKQWGSRGPAPGQLEVPHTLALDSRGRLFVGDRWNNRISIFNQDGKLLDVWSQFGRPSGVFIDRDDVLYVADSESREPEGYGHHPGWKRGIRIGSGKTGQVTAYIPDTEPDPDKGATSGAEGIWVDARGVIYGAQVFQKTVVRYTKKP
jgi:sugar lactone lactonase YvrE/mono/diheme cytochrome c family protein